MLSGEGGATEGPGLSGTASSSVAQQAFMEVGVREEASEGLVVFSVGTPCACSSAFTQVCQLTFCEEDIATGAHLHQSYTLPGGMPWLLA